MNEYTEIARRNGYSMASGGQGNCQPGTTASYDMIDDATRRLTPRPQFEPVDLAEYGIACSDRQPSTADGETRGVDPSQFTLKFITSAELNALDLEISFHIPGLVPAKQPGVIGAPSKGMKTTCAAAGGLSISSGAPLFGNFPVEIPARVAMVSAESGFAALRQTARSIAAASGKSLDDYRDMLWCDQVLDLGNRDHMRQLKSFALNEGIGVFILDPAYLLAPGLGDLANNLFEVGKYLRELTVLGMECGCSIALVHHFKKLIGEPFQEPEMEWLAHAGFGNWMRWWWLLNRRSKYDPEKRGYHELWFQSGGSNGHAGAWALDVDEGLVGGQWEVAVRFASEARNERAEAEASVKQKRRDAETIAKDTATRIKVQNALNTFKAGGTLSDIAAVAKCASNVAKGVVHNLKLAGAVEDWAVIKSNGQKYAGFILKEFGDSIRKQNHPDSPTVGVESECVGVDTEHHPDTPT